MRPSSSFLVFACVRSAFASDPSHVVAVGDLHGDLDNALAVLELAGVIDGDGAWALGDGTFVQTGDITDRGPDSKALMELLTRLEAEAAEAGGQVVALIGNHEAMNVLGDWRYVHPGDVQAYGGVARRRAAFSADGEAGRWIRAHDAIALVGDTVFVHGGVNARWATEGIDALNAAIRAGLDGPPGPVHGPDGPLWFRGYALAPGDQGCGDLARALELLGARRMVVGHTAQRNGAILSRCGGRLHVIDVGISDAYGGHLAAWTSSDGDARAITPDGVIDLEDPPP